MDFWNDDLNAHASEWETTEATKIVEEKKSFADKVRKGGFGITCVCGAAGYLLINSPTIAAASFTAAITSAYIGSIAHRAHRNISKNLEAVIVEEVLNNRIRNQGNY